MEISEANIWTRISGEIEVEKKISGSSTARDETCEPGRIMFSLQFYGGVCKQKDRIVFGKQCF